MYLQIHKYTNTQVHKYTNVNTVLVALPQSVTCQSRIIIFILRLRLCIYKYTNTKIRKYTNVHTQIHIKCWWHSPSVSHLSKPTKLALIIILIPSLIIVLTNTRIHRYTDTQIHKYTNTNTVLVAKYKNSPCKNSTHLARYFHPVETWGVEVGNACCNYHFGLFSSQIQNTKIQ